MFVNKWIQLINTKKGTTDPHNNMVDLKYVMLNEDSQIQKSTYSVATLI